MNFLKKALVGLILGGSILLGSGLSASAQVRGYRDGWGRFHPYVYRAPLVFPRPFVYRGGPGFRRDWGYHYYRFNRFERGREFGRFHRW